MVMNLETLALEKDEVFLFLVLIYCESKRQDKMVSRLGFITPLPCTDARLLFLERFWRLARVRLLYVACEPISLRERRSLRMHVQSKSQPFVNASIRPRGPE
jgi:hypothetical protein